ncbi:MAG: xanthine dehydrogenase family protein subunit M, partial [Pirellulales bacterium]
DRGRAVVEGDNRYHAVLGNRGPAKFVSASRLAPAMISFEAQVRVIGPTANDETFMPLEELYQTPHDEQSRENTLLPKQVVTHVILPPDRGDLSAAYEVRHGEGPDPPLAPAAVTLEAADGVVRDARVVLGQVAPIPWISEAAARALIGRPITHETAEIASTEAMAGVMPLSENQYKVELAQVAVRRAIGLAAGLGQAAALAGGR